jgi:hypothetical protein
MEEYRMPKKIFTQELKGTRRRGRPRKEWKEEVERDLQVLGVRRLKKMVTDIKNGRKLFNRPKVTPGCSASGRRRRWKVYAFAYRFHSFYIHRTSHCTFLYNNWYRVQIKFLKNQLLPAPPPTKNFLSSYPNIFLSTLKANSHTPCRAHSAHMPFSCHAAPLPFSDRAVCFVKVRVVAGNIRTVSPTV